MPLLSIVVPHRNDAKSLPRLLDSIAAQSFKDLEVVLVDDCSEESCLPVVEAYRANGLEITFLPHQQRVYTLEARVQGTMAAKGEIITFADADDALWGETELENNINLFLQKQPDILHFRLAITDSQGNFVRWSPQSDDLAPELLGQDIFSRYAASPNFFALSSLCNKIFSKRLFSSLAVDVSGTKIRSYAEDMYILAIAMAKAKKYVGSPHVGYGYAYNEPAKYSHAHERAAAYYHAMRELPPRLEALGCPKNDIEQFVFALVQQLCVSVGHMSLSAVQNDGMFIADKTIETFLSTIDSRILIKVLLLGNSLNAQKVLDTRAVILRTAGAGKKLFAV